MGRFISTKEFADKYGISESIARRFARNGRIEGAERVGRTWIIPADAVKPAIAKSGRPSTRRKVQE